MNELHPFVRSMFFNEFLKLKISTDYYRRNEIESVISRMTVDLIQDTPIADDFNTDSFSSYMFEHLLEAKVLVADSPRYAGTYYQSDPQRYLQFRNGFLMRDGISVTAKRIGARFFEDVFFGFLSERGASVPTATEVPAADRVVTIDHNGPEYRLVSEGLEELGEAIRSINSSELDEAERSRLLSGIFAAQRLWEASQLKLIQIKVGIIMIVEDARAVLSTTAQRTAGALIVDAIKGFIKSRFHIDLDML
ncbi:hypothetical protein GRI62_06625 [Erythrobacter arachoides]|uniref:Uncharacterized protein n=1 Tax=Aurantiacibacter arachoides TaxID=1850444 RepID=A0A844ZYC0_9SPHN|nr:hypothetical protein [Aurantiacibacter arachoides]MXO93281.1 hypothetical protein [Aurantiacibacter arachoides]GGD50549.1 hypothetical protein GCM10011411_08030 [Aurantiacibacter arachoides]